MRVELDSMGCQQGSLAGDHTRQPQDHISDFRGRILRRLNGIPGRKGMTGISAGEKIISQVYAFQSLPQGCQHHNRCILIYNVMLIPSESDFLELD